MNNALTTEAIITDLDGTILPHGGQISPKTIQALEKTGKKGILRIIATGRNLFAARKVIPDTLPIDYLVFSSGAGTMRWNDKEIISAHHLSRQETRELAAYLWNYNINFTIQQEIPENHHFYYTDLYPLHDDFRHRIETYREFGTCIETTEEIKTGATQLIMILDPVQLHLLEQVRNDLKNYSVIRSTSPVDNRAIWLEIFPPAIHKGSTCSSLLRQLGISPQACAGIGNDYNDVDFLDICGQAYLVANAPQRLKPHYKSVVSDKEEGFTEFIDRLL